MARNDSVDHLKNILLITFPICLLFFFLLLCLSFLSVGFISYFFCCCSNSLSLQPSFLSLKLLLLKLKEWHINKVNCFILLTWKIEDLKKSRRYSIILKFLFTYTYEELMDWICQIFRVSSVNLFLCGYVPWLIFHSTAMLWHKCYCFHLQLKDVRFCEIKQHNEIYRIITWIWLCLTQNYFLLCLLDSVSCSNLIVT